MTQDATQPGMLNRKALNKIFEHVLSTGLQLPFFWVIIAANGEKASGYTESFGQNNLNEVRVNWDFASEGVPLPADVFLFDRNGDGARVTIAVSGKAQCFTVPLSQYDVL